MSDDEGRYKLCDFGSCTSRVLVPDTRRDILEVSFSSNPSRKTFPWIDCAAVHLAHVYVCMNVWMWQIEEEVERMTTLAYRAPEMVDLYRRQTIHTKADVWVGVPQHPLTH